MAEYQRFTFIYLLLLSCFASTLHALQFAVGGKDGWVANPFENYNHWAERMRFQVNDTLLFKYPKGSDSVLVVKKDDYDQCNTENPILKLQDGNSRIRFDRSGLFFFISGTQSNCANGQKLIVVVLAVRNSNSLPTPSSPPPQQKAPHVPPSEAPASTTTPPSSPPADQAPAPASADGPTVDSSPSPAVNSTNTTPPAPPHRSSAAAASVSSLALMVSMVSLAYLSIIF